jgi:hypothetical protein
MVTTPFPDLLVPPQPDGLDRAGVEVGDGPRVVAEPGAYLDEVVERVAGRPSHRGGHVPSWMVLRVQPSRAKRLTSGDTSE